MSRIDDMIEELCPDGVEFRPLGEIGEFVRGTGLQKKDLRGRGVPAIHYGEIHTHYGTWATETKSFVDHASSPRWRRAKPGNLVIATTSEDDEAVGKATAWLGVDDAVVSGDAFIFRHTLEPKYVAYFFQSGDFQAQKRRHISGTKVRRISGTALAKISIPVPPLEVQREIVKTLDLFSQLEAELEAELEARRKQYEHFAERLLAVDGQARFLKLGEVAKVVRGASPRPIAKFVTDAEDGVPWIKIGDVPTGGKFVTETEQRITLEGATKSRTIRPGDFVLSNSMSFGRPYISAIEGCVHDGWLVISGFDDAYDRDYLYYLLRSDDVQRAFASRAGAGTVKNLNADIVRSVRLPLPPMEEQRRIAAILDKFDALVNDISVGLPAELEARRKQYEYYRDKLLTFKELGA